MQSGEHKVNPEISKYDRYETYDRQYRNTLSPPAPYKTGMQVKGITLTAPAAP